MTPSHDVSNRLAQKRKSPVDKSFRGRQTSRTQAAPDRLIRVQARQALNYKPETPWLVPPTAAFGFWCSMKDAGRLVKISRFAHRFWVKVTSEEVGDTIVGTVQNDIGREELPLGAQICFLGSEILEEMRPGDN